MSIEYEATYLNINKEELRKKLTKIGAKLLRPEYKQKRYSFDLQPLGKDFWQWARVRDEGNKITMAYKSIPLNSRIEEQEEVEIEISDFNLGVELLEKLGAKIKNYSENLRERWIYNDVEIDIDTWPYLDSYVEIEGKNKEDVEKVTKILGYKFSDALFCGVGKIYEIKYGIHPDKIYKDKILRLTFEDPNPFL